ncbi:2837_t:CDS:2, partial [Cetraspora pellucida]
MIDVRFPLRKGWALKGNQKLGNRGSGTRIKKSIKSRLEHFFISGNKRIQDRMNAQAMHDELLKYAGTGDIEEKDIPQVSTIQNWLNNNLNDLDNNLDDNLDNNLDYNLNDNLDSNINSNTEENINNYLDNIYENNNKDELNNSLDDININNKNLKLVI